jgi:rhomboid family GlyGly-CTERM serine protease
MPATPNAGQLKPAGRPPGMADVLLPATIVIAAFLAQLLPDLATAFEWKRESMGAGVTWGILTGHLAHWSWNHLAWDLAAFVVLTVACLRVRPNRLAATLGLSALTIPIVVFAFHPELATYRGLSGIDSALFALFLTGLWKTGAAGSRSRPLNGARLLVLAGTAIFLAKVGYEIVSGQTLFVDSSEAGFIPVPSAHLAGFASGLVAGGLPARHPPVAL